MKIIALMKVWSGEEFLKPCIESIQKQSIKPLEIIVIDNASTDKTVKIIQDTFPTVHLMRNVNNIGLCRAWNQGIQMTSGEYVLIMNPDLILDKEYAKQSLKILAADQTVASVGGKLYQLKVISLDEDGLSNLEKTSCPVGCQCD